MTPVDDRVLTRFHNALVEMYGDRLNRVVLFGSGARGDAQDDSDYDIAVFLNEMSDRTQEMNRLADLRVDFLDATGVFFDAKPFLSTAHRERTPLMAEIRRDGLNLSSPDQPDTLNGRVSCWDGPT